MSDTVSEALRILARFWLEEVRPDDPRPGGQDGLALIVAIPDLAETLVAVDSKGLTDLAAEYQRLFGFNLPPYESVFIDPSAMLMAPATERVQMLYRQAGWASPGEARAGAPDHLGLELLALADWLEAGQAKPSPWPGGKDGLARQLQTRHLALWAPAFCLALKQLEPHPFYATLGSLTLDLLLATLVLDAIPPGSDPFPVLPPAPVYAERGLPSAPGPGPRPAETTEPLPVTLRDLVKRLLIPREAGMFLTRHHIARISHTLDLPEAMGERSHMLETLFRLADQYDLVPALFEQLTRLLTEAEVAYQTLRDEYPAWTTYAQAWCQRLASTQLALNSLSAQARL